MSSGRVAVVLGTRPEIVKLAPLLRLLGASASIIHTGQHYDEAMSGRFLGELGLATPELQLDIGGLPRGDQIARALQGIDAHLRAHPPAVVVVQGDTNSALAGALAANGCGIPLVHVEAGLRSYDRAMPEEHNRVLIDHLADLLCAPTAGNVANLAAEGLTAGVELTGNTVVEAVTSALPDPASQHAVVVGHGVRPNRYVLATIHRPENTDDPVRLASILRDLGKLDLPVLLPLHPRTRSAAIGHGLSPLLDDLRVLEPMAAAEFLSLAAHAALIVSDSGGLQEECTILKRPLVVVRRSTERPESTPDFATVVDPAELLSAALDVIADRAHLDAHLARLSTIASPYGDGDASRRIATCIERLRHDSNVRPSDWGR